MTTVDAAEKRALMIIDPVYALSGGSLVIPLVSLVGFIAVAYGYFTRALARAGGGSPPRRR